jgi:hypothetical protein
LRNDIVLRLLVLATFAIGLCACGRAEVVDPRVRVLVGHARVVLLSASWCGYFSEYDVETSDIGRRAYDLIGERGVPILLIGQRQLYGYSSGYVRRLLDEAGALPPAAIAFSAHPVFP